MSQSPQSFDMEMRAKGYVETSPGVWDRNPFQASPNQSAGEPVERESDLHDQIEAELKRRRWYYVHSRMDRATTTQLGVTDFIIAAPPTGNVGQPRTFWVECKREGEKLNKEQTVTKHVLLALGHKHFVVFSFEEFLDQIK
jgi:hypothetical protein